MFNVIVTGITSFLTDLSTEMVYPLIPLFLAALGAPPAALGLIEGFAESTASLLKVFSGRLSDKLGRRKPLAILGYAGSGLGKLLLYLAHGWGLVFAGRMTDRIGKGIRVAPRDAIIADCTPEGRRGRAYGLHRAMDTLGAAAGVVVAILLVRSFPPKPSPADFLPVFLLSLVPALLGVAALFLVREPRCPSPVAGRPPLSFRGLPSRLRWFLLVVGLFALGNSSNQFLILRTRGLGWSVAMVLGAYLLYNVVYSLLSYPAGRIADRFGRKRLLIAGYCFYGLVYFGFALLPSGKSTIVDRQSHFLHWLPWLLFGLYGLYSALTEGLEKALVADIAPAGHRATFIGLHSTLVGIGLLPASLIAGLLWSTISPSAPFWFGGCLGLAAALGLALVL
ncbi:MFS transporter [candidate division WOR-3 bacterium]|nr:MFS transporter [candidate division WOR-3 bacterium]